MLVFPYRRTWVSLWAMVMVVIVVVFCSFQVLVAHAVEDDRPSNSISSACTALTVVRGGMLFDGLLIEVNPDYIPPPHLIKRQQQRQRQQHRQLYYSSFLSPPSYSYSSSPTAPPLPTPTPSPVQQHTIRNRGSVVTRNDDQQHPRQPKYILHSTSFSDDRKQLQQQQQPQQHQQLRRYYQKRRPASSITMAASALSIRQFLESLRLVSGPAISNTALVCIGIYILWQFPSCHEILGKWFVCRPTNPPLSILLSSVSHAGLAHLVLNLMAFFSLGAPVRQILFQTASWPVWPLLLGSSITGSLFHLALLSGGARGGKGRLRQLEGCMGLSDVTLAVLAVYARLLPTARLGVMLAGLIPVRMSASQLLGVLTAWSFLGCLLTSMSSVAHAAHLGGLVFGLAYFEAWSRRDQWQPCLLHLKKKMRTHMG